MLPHRLFVYSRVVNRVLVFTWDLGYYSCFPDSTNAVANHCETRFYPTGDFCYSYILSCDEQQSNKGRKETILRTLRLKLFPPYPSLDRRLPSIRPIRARRIRTDATNQSTRTRFT